MTIEQIKEKELLEHLEAMKTAYLIMRDREASNFAKEFYGGAIFSIEQTIKWIKEYD